VHEWVHQGIPVPTLLQPLARIGVSLLIGMPFDGYRWHHWNHHQFENGPEDFSTTWTVTPKGLEPQAALRYALTWPRQLVRSSLALRRQVKEGRISSELQGWIGMQKWALGLTFLAAGILVPHAFAIYVSVIYGGWMLVALHNHGQHPPIPDATPTTYRSRWYNMILCGNGLHGEHHQNPRTAWNQLVESPLSRTVHWPHLVDPLMPRPPATP
jgi:fatty acid desaturase